MSHTAKLRALLRQDGMIVAPGAYDGITARLIEQAGFGAVYMTGAGTSATFGYPDFGLLTMTEMVGNAARIVRAVSVPVIADADTGYGNALNVIRTVRGLERAGVAALQLEDQDLPKKCGSMPGKLLISADAMAGKIKAAVDARSDPNLLIIARTDALASEGANAALDRLGRYREAGADLLMVLGPYDRTTAHELIRRSPGPLAYFNAESLTMPMLPPAELHELGVPLVIFPTALILAAAKAMQNTLQTILTTGSTEALIGSELVSPNDFNALVGLAALRSAEARYVV